MGPANTRLLLVVALLLPASHAHALLGHELPLDHWENGPVHELRMRGVDLVTSGGLRPFDGSEVAARAERIDSAGSAVDPRVEALLDLVLREARTSRDTRDGRGSEQREAALALWFEPVVGELPGGEVPTDLPLDRRKAVLRPELAARWNHAVSAYYRAEFDSDGADDPDFLGIPWKHGITGMSEYCALTIRGGGIDDPGDVDGGNQWKVVLGRSHAAWGPFDDGLLLSGHHAAYDGARAQARWGPVRVAWLAGQLDALPVTRSQLPAGYPEDEFPEDGTPRDVPRFISAHRIEWEPRPGLTFGGSEAVLYGGPNRTWEAYYLLPFVPFYAEQWNRGTNDNLMVGLDVEWFPARGRRIAGELLLDDVQYSPDNEPQEIGGTIAWSEVMESLPGAPRAELEYARVNPYVYGQSYPWNRWTMGRMSLGSPLGSDVDRWRFAVTAIPARGWILSGEGYRVRKGEIDPETPRPVRVPFLPDFPSGSVEERTGGVIGVEWIAPPVFRTRCWLGVEDVENTGHRPGENEVRALAGIEVRVGFQRLSP